MEQAFRLVRNTELYNDRRFEKGKIKMNKWQVIWIVLNGIVLGINLAKHGEPRKSKYDFWSSLFGISLEIFILYKGGFF